MSIFRFSAEFRFFFFLLSAFLKMIFRFFWKIAQQFFFFLFTDTATIDSSKSFGKQSVTSWFAGMRFFRFRSMFESAVSPLSTPCSKSDAHSHVACWCTAWAASTRVVVGGGGGGGGDGFVSGLRTGSKWSQEFYPSKSSICTPSLSTLITLHTHTLSLPLSLSYTHTHTPLTFRAASCCDLISL